MERVHDKKKDTQKVIIWKGYTTQNCIHQKLITSRVYTTEKGTHPKSIYIERVHDTKTYTPKE